jgi:hypothetical protein
VLKRNRLSKNKKKRELENFSINEFYKKQLRKNKKINPFTMACFRLNKKREEKKIKGLLKNLAKNGKIPQTDKFANAHC